MEITLLFKSFMGLVGLLLLLIIFLFYSPKKLKVKKRAQVVENKHDDYQTLDELLGVIKNKKSTTDELKNALDLVMKYHDKIHPDFNIYGEMLLRVCRHPNINKDILLKFNRELEKRNEGYKREINDAVTIGLDSRGF